MLREVIRQLDSPWLFSVALVIALPAVPFLVRFAIGDNFHHALGNLGVGVADRFQRQLTVIRMLLRPQRWLSLRIVVFVGGYFIVSGAIYLCCARIAQWLS